MNKRQVVFTLAVLLVSTLVSAFITNRMVVAQSSPSRQAAAVTSSEPKYEFQIVFGTPKNANYVMSQLNKLSEQGYNVAGYSAATDEVGRPSFSVLVKRIKP